MSREDLIDAAIRPQDIYDLAAKLCVEKFTIFLKLEWGSILGPQHFVWEKDLSSGCDVIELCPRDHSKSSSLAQAYPVWRIKYSDWVKDVLIIGPDLPSAIENLDKIKDKLASRPSLRSLLPNTGRRVYSRTEMRLSNQKTIKVKGWGSPLRGRHPQLIIFDDILNEKNSQSREGRREVKTRFNAVFLPMKDKGFAAEDGTPQREKSQIVVSGTAQNIEDLYHEMLESPDYVGHKLKAVISDSLQTTLWPRRYSYQDLMEIKRKVGTLVFNQEYNNEPITDDTSLFPSWLFEPLKDPTLSYVESYSGSEPTYLGTDFSVPGNQSGDWTVTMAIRVEPTTKLITLLNYSRTQPSLVTSQFSEIELYCGRYRIVSGLLEANSFQAIYPHVLKSRTALPLKGHTVSATNKNDIKLGVLSFRPIIENLKLKLPYKTDSDKEKTDHLIQEFQGVKMKNGSLGNTNFHDDCVMALWHAVTAARFGSVFSFDFI